MKVNLREQTTLDSLLRAEETHAFDDGMSALDNVREMVYADSARLADFGFSTAVIGRARQVAEDANDDSPEFVVVRTEEGWSRGGRLYDGSILESIAEQVNANQPVAHLGHIKDEDMDTAFPEPQTKWLGAVIRQEASKIAERAGQLVKVIYTAGYNLPGAKIRGYLKTGVVDSTSWQGVAEQTPIPGKGLAVKKFVLHSLDWSRKGSEGMATARVVALAREMATKEHEGGKMDKELAQVTPEEFKAENPNGYQVLVSEISAKKDEEIATLQTQVDEAKADRELLAEARKALGADEGDDLLGKIAHAMQRLGERAKVSVDAALDKILAERVPDEEQRKLVRRLMPVSEMEAKAADAKDGEEAETLVREMATTAFDEDDIVKQIVSEQSAPIVRRREELESGGDLDKALAKAGVKRERVKMGS